MCAGWYLIWLACAARRFCVATYPGVQERLSAELAAAGLLASAKQPQPRELEFSDIFALPILEAVCTPLLWLPTPA